jgi:YVTN family beta-propeller protein
VNCVVENELKTLARKGYALRALCLIAFTLCFPITASAANLNNDSSLSKPILLVVNHGDATVSLVDPNLLHLIKNVAKAVPRMVGHEVDVSADGNFAYVPLYGDSGLGRPGSDGDVILVLDLNTGTISNQIHFRTGVRPHRPILNSKDKHLYVTTELLNSISIVDTKTFKVVGTIPTGAAQSHMLALSRDGRFGYTANVSSGTISVLDLKSRSLVHKIQVATTIQRIAVSADDRVLATSDQLLPRLAIIDVKTQGVRWIPLPSSGCGSAFTGDGKTLLITMPQAGQLALIDLEIGAVKKVIDIGPRPQEVLIRPDGKLAYVSCFGSNFVAAVDLSSNTVVDRVETGAKADGMAWVSSAK